MTGASARRIAVEARRRRARSLAADAVAALAAKGIAACAIGSLERPDFREDSDVDLLVDCGWDRYADAREACRAAFGDFPFDVVPRHDVGPEVAEAMVAEAAVLIPFASVGRRAEVVQGVLDDLVETVARLEILAPGHAEAPMMAGLAGTFSRELVERLAKLLRRVVLDADGDMPADACPSIVFEAAAATAVAGHPIVRPGTATFLAGLPAADEDVGWTSRRNPATALSRARPCVEAGRAALADVEAFVAAVKREAAPDGMPPTATGPARPGEFA